MKKLINKIKSWFVREDESDKLFRIASELCEKYGHKTTFVKTELSIYNHGKPFRCYNIYTPETGHISVGESNTLELVTGAFELKLKNLYHAKTKNV